MPKVTIKQEANRPWGPLLGLLAGCVVAVVGIARGLEPEIILLRCAGAALACGLVVGFLRALVQYLQAS